MLLTPKKFGGMQNTSRYLVSIGHITGHDTNLVCRMSHCHHQNPRDPNPSGTNRDLVTADPGIKWLGRAFIICMYITYAHCSRLWGHIGIYIYIQVYIHIIYNTYIVYIYLTHVYIYITYIGMYIYAYIYIYMSTHTVWPRHYHVEVHDAQTNMYIQHFSELENDPHIATIFQPLNERCMN